VSFATGKDVGNYPLRQGRTLQGIDEIWQSSAMIQCALSSRSPGDENDFADLKQEDNLRPKKMCNTANDTAKKAACSGFFFLLAADNHVADPLTLTGPLTSIGKSMEPETASTLPSATQTG
jgi:hypothetical protein